MKLLTLTIVAGLLLSLNASIAKADNLLIERVRNEQGVSLPNRGTSMSQVEAQFGAPQQKVAAVGGGSRTTPPITRWVYKDFSVYFENTHVVDAVLNKADAYETGPAPARQ
ncbi:MAG: hypothetical protein ABIP02_09700 [Arenimonas sp.]